jgi:ABC-2 type transport system ATP-binding protein
MDCVLQTSELTKRYGSLLALDRCTLEVHRGQVFGLLGPNGAGKSTLVRTLLGFLQPSGGWGKILGYDCVAQSVAVRQVTAYLPGDARLFRQMRGSEVLHFFASMRPLIHPDRHRQLAERLELDLSRRVVFMSTGMRQKLALVAVLGSSVPLIILDEPTANLDPTVRNEVLSLVREAQQQGQTVIFSSHVLSEIEEVCDEVVLLKRGQLVKRLHLSELQQSHRLFARSEQDYSDIPESLRSRIQLVRQGGGEVVLDLQGDLSSLMSWLGQQSWSQLRIEARGLDHVYQQVHPPAQTTHFSSAMNSLNRSTTR